MSPSLWEHEMGVVVRVYPGAQWRDVTEGSNQTRAWYLTMDPIPHEEELHQVLADLDAGIGVSVGHRGKVGHSKVQCGVPLESHAVLFPHTRLTPLCYLVELTYQRPPQNAAGPAQPRARIVSPEISVRTYPKHPHMYVGNGFDSWACPLSPQDTRWTWGKGATVSYLDQVAIWLLKTAVWIATGAGIAGLGKWLGLDTSHAALDLLRMIGPTDPCWCGRGVRYEKCHMQLDVSRAIRERIF